MGLFDKILQKPTPIENQSIKRLQPKMKEWKVDLLLITTSRLCDFCGKYNRKVYSLYGWNKKYPKIPKEMLDRRCPVCEKFIGASMFFEGVSTLPKD